MELQSCALTSWMHGVYEEERLTDRALLQRAEAHQKPPWVQACEICVVSANVSGLYHC